MNSLSQRDPSLAKLLAQETQRQQETIDLIPSESLVEPALLEVLGSPLTNKYSEGQAGKRYYPGNQFIDEIERLAKERAKAAFALTDDWQVNVQALSGSPANLAVYCGLLEKDETIMGLNLFSGGHLTHGHKVNLSGRFFNSIQYGLGQNNKLDFDLIAKLAKDNKPKIIISGFTAYPYQIDFEKFGQIAKSVGAWHLADISHIAGLVSAKLHPSPFPYVDVITTTTHKTLNGPRAALIFAKEELMEKINRAVFPMLQGGPHNNAIGAVAYALKRALDPDFKLIQKQIVLNAKALADELLLQGFDLVGGGTENHLMLIDLRKQGIAGQSAEQLLEKANIIVNRNSLPHDTSPFHPSGLRPGSPSITFRGMKEKEARQIGRWFGRLLIRKEDPTAIQAEVKALCQRFPLPY